MGKKWKQWQTLFSWAPKSLQVVIAAMKCKNKQTNKQTKTKHLLLGRKVMTNLDSILKKQRHYFANKGPSSQSYGFSISHVWMWELYSEESWAPKNWCFWTVVWRRLLQVPWTARRFNQSILKEVSPEYSLEGPMLKLKLQYFGHLIRRADSFEKTLMLGKS